jgi:glucokinase
MVEHVHSGLDEILVGDVGGTHARFAVALATGEASWRITSKADLERPFETFRESLVAYLARAELSRLPKTAVIAAAGPVLNGSVALTNRNWRVSKQDLEQAGFPSSLVINDFAALAFAADALQPGDLQTIGPDLPGLPDGPISIVGAGTGFGVSCRVRNAGRVIALATEAGHGGFAPNEEREVAVWRLLTRWFGRASLERVLSGPGIVNLHRALDEIAGRPASALSAERIVQQALQGEANCFATLTMFCSIYGAAAGDIALTQGARGGVLLAGGIAPRIARILSHGPFRARFEDKGRLAPYMRAIPTRLIVNPEATLLGAARAALELSARKAS